MRIAELVSRSDRWMHRRVERIVIEPTSECTRYISIDFTLPTEWAVTGSSPSTMLVPLGLFRKGPLVALSCHAPSGAPAPVLETSANAELAIDMLVAIADRMAGASTGGADNTPDIEAFRAFVTPIVFHSGEPVDGLAEQISSDREVWGTAVNPIAKLLLLSYAFDTLGVARVGLRCDTRNRRSHNAIRRLGAVFEGTLRCYRPAADGSIADVDYFSIVAPERDAVVERLRHRADALTG